MQKRLGLANLKKRFYQTKSYLELSISFILLSLEKPFYKFEPLPLSVITCHRQPGS